MVTKIKVKGLMREAGYQFTLGAISAASVIALLCMFVGWAFDRMGWSSFNSSDTPGHHSGMSVKTDALTGCEYLDASSLTPRLGVDGKQICVPTK